MPQLAEHMFRVAGVAAVICEKINAEAGLRPDDSRDILTACLIHDLGNIVKFDLSSPLTPANLRPQLDYWENVKKQTAEKYGTNDHTATMAIISEIKVSPRVYELADNVGFICVVENFKSSDYARKICGYADMRVAPSGVVNIEERMRDGRQRYKGKKTLVHNIELESYENALRGLEKQIFEHCATVTPDSINNETVAPYASQLKTFQF